MATRKIETTIALDGEQQFKQALASAAREMRVLESESRALSAAYDKNSASAASYAARQQNLRSQIQQQEHIVSALERAVEDSAKAYGEASAQTDGWAIKLNNARTRLSRLQKELEATDREAEELGRDSIKVGRQIDEGIGDGAREAEESVNSLFDAMRQDVASIKTSGAIMAVQSLWDMASNAYSSVEGFVDGTLDYRRQLSLLLYNSQSTGFGTEHVEKSMIEVTGMVNDTSAAVEGLSNLLQIGFPDQNRFSEAMQNLLGATVKWPDTMKFENLAESLQETLATGKAVGAYGELLERLGYNLDDFNKALDKSDTKVGDIDIALKYLKSEELAAAYNKYRENNAALIDEMEAIARLELQSARIGQTLAENIFTPMKKVGAETFSWLADVLETWDQNGFEAAAKKVLEDAAKAHEQAVEVIEDTAEKTLENAFKKLPEPIQNALKPMLPVAKEFADDAEQVVTNAAKGAGMVVEAVAGVVTDPFGTGEKIVENVKETVAKAKQGAKESTQKERQIELLSSLLAGRYYDEINAEVTGPEGETYEVIGTGKRPEDVIKSLGLYKESYREAGEENADAYLNGFETEVDMSDWEAKPAEQMTTLPTEAIAAAGEEAGQTMTDSFGEGVEGMEGAAKDIGVAAGISLAAGLASQVSYVSAASSALAAAAARGIAAISGLRGAMTGGLPFVINLDGRQVGAGLAPYSSEFMASQLTTDVFIN